MLVLSRVRGQMICREWEQQLKTLLWCFLYAQNLHCFPVVGPSWKEAWCLRRPYLLSQCFGLDYLSLNACSRKKNASDSHCLVQFSSFSEMLSSTSPWQMDRWWIYQCTWNVGVMEPSFFGGKRGWAFLSSSLFLILNSVSSIAAKLTSHL